MEQGVGLLTDVLSRENVKTTAKRRAQETFSEAKQDRRSQCQKEKELAWQEEEKGTERREKGENEGGVGCPLEPTFSGIKNYLRAGCRIDNMMQLEQLPKQYASSHGGSSALELFSLPPTDTTVLSNKWQPYYPEASIQRGSPIEFNIETTPDYIDLSNCYMKFTFKVTKANGNNLDAKCQMHSREQCFAHRHKANVR